MLFEPYYDACDHLRAAVGELEWIRANPAGVDERVARAMIARTNRACDEAERRYEEIQSPDFLQHIMDRFEPIPTEAGAADTSFADRLWGKPVREGLFW
jgi:hypothetical protein